MPQYSRAMPKHEKEWLLTGLDLDEIALVPSGDDPAAQVVIAKAAPQEDDGKSHWFFNRVKKSGESQKGSSTLRSTTNREEAMPEQITKDDLPAEVVEYIEALEGEVDTLTEAVAKAEAAPPAPVTAETLAAALLNKGAPGEVTPEWLSKADPEMKTYIEKQAAELAEVKEIAKAERDARVKAEYIAKAESFTALPGETNELAETLRALHETSPELATKVENILVASDAQLRKSAIFKEFGNAGNTTINKSVEGKIAELRKSDPSLTKEAAEARVYSEHPDLYDAQEA